MSYCLQISQQQAIDSLKRAKGVATEALKHELSKMKINSDLLMSLTLQYCQFRGLIGEDKVNLIRKREQVQPLPGNMQEKFEKLRQVRQLAAAGKATEVLSLATSLDPDFPSEAPHLYFELKRCEFVEKINRCDFNTALEIMRGCLGPMSLKFPELIAKVKESAVLMAFNSSPPQIPALNVHPDKFAGPLYTILGQKTGLAEPEIISILKYLLHVHTLWFATMGSKDGFESFFNLQELKTADSQGPEVKKQKIEEKKELEITDKDVATLMEALAIPRGEAISLLKAYDGNLENIFAGWMA